MSIGFFRCFDVFCICSHFLSSLAPGSRPLRAPSGAGRRHSRASRASGASSASRASSASAGAAVRVDARKLSMVTDEEAELSKKLVVNNADENSLVVDDEQ